MITGMNSAQMTSLRLRTKSRMLTRAWRGKSYRRARKWVRTIRRRPNKIPGRAPARNSLLMDVPVRTP